MGDDLPQAPGPGASTVEINEDTDISKLTNAQLHELNQNLLDETAEVTRPLIDKVAPMAVLRAEYENGSVSFVQQIDWLTAQGYKSIRRTRGDGDCFYRSVAFAYIERLMYAPDRGLAVASGISVLESTLPMLRRAGFQALVFEDFYDVLVSVIESVVYPDTHGRTLDAERLLRIFQKPEISNSIVVYLRLVTSAQIRDDPDSFAPFLFHPELGLPMEVREFCESFVEAVSKEADHVQMTALSRALQLNINVAYLDGRGGQVDFVEFRNPNDDGTLPLILLYRPGHYDILERDEKGGMNRT